LALSTSVKVSVISKPSASAKRARARLLSLEAQTGLALPRRGDPDVRNAGRMTEHSKGKCYNRAINSKTRTRRATEHRRWHRD
jgi:hypothetical protein